MGRYRRGRTDSECGVLDLIHSSRTGTKPRRYVVTREERGSLPVGTDRPTRRRPAALDRPVTPGPLLPGRLPPTVYSPNTDSNPCTGCRRPVTFIDSTPLRPQPSSSRTREDRVPRKITPRRVPNTRRSTIPQGHTWVPPSQPPLQVARRLRRFAPRERILGTLPSGSVLDVSLLARPSRIRDVVPTQNSLFSSMVASDIRSSRIISA
jgi:hypothetical protein